MVAVFANAVAAEHQLLQKLHTGSDARVVENDRIVDHGSLADVAARADHRGPNDRGTIFNLGHAAHIDGTTDVDLVPVGGNVQTCVDTWLDLLARDSHLTDFTEKHTADGLPVVRHFADVHPFEVHGNRIEGCS